MAPPGGRKPGPTAPAKRFVVVFGVSQFTRCGPFGRAAPSMERSASRPNSTGGTSVAKASRKGSAAAAPRTARWPWRGFVLGGRRSWRSPSIRPAGVVGNGHGGCGGGCDHPKASARSLLIADPLRVDRGRSAAAPGKPSRESGIGSRAVRRQLRPIGFLEVTKRLPRSFLVSAQRLARHAVAVPIKLPAP